MTLLRTILMQSCRSSHRVTKGIAPSDRSRRLPRAEGLEDRRLLAGYFLAPVSSTIAANPSAVQVADFNRDGRPDLAVLTDAGVQVEFNNGSGGFVTGPTLTAAMGFTPRSLAVGDMNRDGRIDIVVTSTSATTIRVRTLLNTPIGFVGALQTDIVVPAGSDVTTSVDDYNRDGIPDAAVTYTPGMAFNSLLVFLKGDGDGTFTLPPAPDQVSGTHPIAAVTADFDRDGAPDIAVLDSAGLSIKINTSFAADPFLFAAPAALAVGTNPRALVTGDFNRDGIPDIAVASDNGIDVLLGDGMGGLPSTSIVPLPGATPGARTLAAIDYNLDGRLDLATFGGDGRLNVLMNTGAPSATGLFTVGPPSTFFAVAPPTNLVATEVSGDGQEDLVVAQQGAATNLSVLQGAQDTAGPRIVSTAISGKGGTLTIVFRDSGSGLNQATLGNLANYQLQIKLKKSFLTVPLKGITVSPPATPGGDQTVVITFNPVKLKQDTTFKIIVPTAGITDNVGNRLDGSFGNLFPSGNGLLPTTDFVQSLVVKKKK